MSQKHQQSNQVDPVDGDIRQALRQSSQSQGLLKPGASRSAVTYVEREHPERKHCEQLILTINLSAAELQYPLEDSGANEPITEDGRTLRRHCWDSAVNALCELLDQQGLRPKALKNDRNSCQLSLQKDYILAGQTVPDEYYSLTMSYYSESELQSKKLNFVRQISRYTQDIEDRTQRLYGRFVTRKVQKELNAEIQTLRSELASFVASNPDPRELDAGLILHVDLLSPREYGETRNAMTQVLSKFIHSLSKIAGGHVRLVQPDVGILTGLRRKSKVEVTLSDAARRRAMDGVEAA
jgi:hypothetical protein